MMHMPNGGDERPKGPRSADTTYKYFLSIFHGTADHRSSRAFACIPELSSVFQFNQDTEPISAAGGLFRVPKRNSVESASHV